MNNKVFKRPMFRKGGEVMDGIMTGIKPREKFQEKGIADELRDRMNLVQSVAGPTGGFADPISQLLISGGLSLASQKRPGGLLANIAGSFQQPAQQLFKNLATERQLKTTLAAGLVKDLSKNDIDKIKNQAQQIAKETGRNYDEVFNALVNKLLYKDPSSPAEMARKTEAEGVKDIQLQGQNLTTDGKSAISKDAAQQIYSAKRDIKQNSPELSSALDPTRDNLSIFDIQDNLITYDEGTNSYKIVDEKGIEGYREGRIYYDVYTKRWYKKQGTSFTPVDRG